MYVSTYVTPPMTLRGRAAKLDTMPEVVCPVLVGRVEELDALQRLWASAVRHGGVVFVTGEAGIGKSRLVRELVSEVGPSDVVASGRAVPTGTAEPFRPIAEGLMQCMRGSAVVADPDLAPWRPALGTILPLAEPAAHGESLPSAARGEAVVQLLARLAPDGRALFVLEDLHWADGDTITLLEYLADNLFDSGVLCVATARSEPATPITELIHRLDARRVSTHLRLARLEEDEVAAMIRACGHPASPDTVARVLRNSDGVPFLVEESLAASGVPEAFADSVRLRMGVLDSDERAVLRAAALLGRRFDWRVLGAITELSDELVAAALAHGVQSQLLEVDGVAFSFRHELTRDAVSADLLPPDRVALAGRALAVLESEQHEPEGADTELVASLAEQAGARHRAGTLLLASGRAALTRGALATAIDTLGRASELVGTSGERQRADDLLLEAFALAGRLDEALVIGERLIARGQPADKDEAAARAGQHLNLSHAAIEATRWRVARHHLQLATGLLTELPLSDQHGRCLVLEAEIAMAGGDVDRALALANEARTLASTETVRCQAAMVLGRLARASDLDQARMLFEEALTIADDGGLVLSRLGALHELGTIDMLDHAGTEQLARARGLADQLGALSTSAVIELQLAAANLFRFQIEPALSHALDALELSNRLDLGKIRATALVFLAEVHALRRDHLEATACAARAEAAAPGDAEIEGSARAGVDGVLALLDDDTDAAARHLERGAAILAPIPTGPAHYLGLRLLLLAASDNATAPTAIKEARAAGLGVNRINRGFLGYAGAILAGRAGDRAGADELAIEADRELRHYPVWADIARLYASEPALQHGWGRPRAWLGVAIESFERAGLDPLADRARRLLDTPTDAQRTQLGITDREAEVLRLVADGLTNREIAGQLFISSRTVEKHVESLLRKTGARTRTQLVPFAATTR